jgi:hypothetical protein
MCVDFLGRSAKPPSSLAQHRDVMFHLFHGKEPDIIFSPAGVNPRVGGGEAAHQNPVSFWLPPNRLQIVSWPLIHMMETESEGAVFRPCPARPDRNHPVAQEVLGVAEITWSV